MKEDNSLLLADNHNWQDTEIGTKINDCDIIIDKINEIEARCLERLESVETLLRKLNREMEYSSSRKLS